MAISSDLEFRVPDGYYPPFTIVTDSNHTGWVIVATALGLALALMSSVMRASVRLTFRQKFGLDDAILAVATLLAIIQESIILGACSKGLGQSIELLDPITVPEVEKSFYTGNIFLILALGLAKVSTAAFILELTPIKSQRQVVHGIIAATTVWVILSVILFALQCNLAHPWQVTGEECKGVYAHLLVICTLDILLEVALFGSTIYLVSDLQTSFSNKAVVIGAFAFRLPLIIAIGLRLVKFNQPGLMTDFSLAEDLYVVWTEIQLNYSLISATIPMLRPFIHSLSTHYGVGAATEYSANTSPSRNNTYRMSTLNLHDHKSKFNSSGSRTDERGLDLTGRMDAYTCVGNAGSSSIHAVALRKDKDSHSVGSNDSRRMMIRKDVGWMVQHDNEGISDLRSSPRDSSR